MLGLASALAPSRFSLYAALSALAAWAVVAHAFATREQFYPAVVYLVTSKLSIVLLSNFAFVLVVLLASACKSLFLGDLRANEVERVNEELRYAVVELIVALIIFREDFNARVVSLFAMLLFSKFFHIVASERMTWLDSPGGAERASRLAHARLVALVGALFLMNAQCLAVFFHILSEQGHSVLLLFAFEYCVLELEVLKVAFRYSIHLVARRMARRAELLGAGAGGNGEWPNRSLYLMYGKLAIDTVKLGVYVMYFLLLVHFYQMPMSMVRDLLRAFADVKRELENVVEVRRLRAQINRMLRPPTAEELERFDATCAVCLNDVTPETRESAKLLHCNHVFHVSCLLSWWERKRTCPTCNADINQMLQNNARYRGPAAAAGAAGAAAAVAAAAVAAAPPAVAAAAGGRPAAPEGDADSAATARAARRERRAAGAGGSVRRRRTAAAEGETSEGVDAGFVG